MWKVHIQFWNPLRGELSSGYWNSVINGKTILRAYENTFRLLTDTRTAGRRCKYCARPLVHTNFGIFMNGRPVEMHWWCIPCDSQQDD